MKNNNWDCVLCENGWGKCPIKDCYSAGENKYVSEVTFRFDLSEGPLTLWDVMKYFTNLEFNEKDNEFTYEEFEDYDDTSLVAQDRHIQNYVGGKKIITPIQMEFNFINDKETKEDLDKIKEEIID